MIDQNRTTRCLWFSICLIFLATPVFADYYATDGKFKGFACKGFGIEVCDWVRVDAVSNGGKLHNLKRNYKTVSEFNSKQGLCHIRTKKEGLLGKLFDKATGPDFYSKQPDGKFKKIDIESLSFNCRKN